MCKEKEKLQNNNPLLWLLCEGLIFLQERQLKNDEETQ